MVLCDLPGMVSVGNNWKIKVCTSKFRPLSLDELVHEYWARSPTIGPKTVISRDPVPKKVCGVGQKR